MANLTNAQLRKTWLDDSYEKAGETAKTAVEHLNYAFNPFAESPFDKKLEKSEQSGVHEAKDQNNSPLDLDQLQQKYGDKINIIPGGGIRPNNIKLIQENTNCTTFHSAAIKPNSEVADEQIITDLIKQLV